MKQGDELRNHLEEAREIVFELRYLRASQCLNCGLVFHNGYETHKPKGIFRRPQCQYNPVGWERATENTQ